MSSPGGTRPVVIVTGMSGGGKWSILRALEDLGFEAVDNPPLWLLDGVVAGTARPLAIGVDSRSGGFDGSAVLEFRDRLRGNPGLAPALVYAWADPEVIERRYTETRRRHPLAPDGLVSAGIEAEERLTAPLRVEADMVIDTSDLPLPGLRQLIDRRFGQGSPVQGRAGLLVSLSSFAFPAGLPRQSDMVFDARFLRNPHYDPTLRPMTGLDPAVGAYIAQDADYAAFYARVRELLALVLPRFVAEGKKVASIAVGCSGGRHRSVHLVERLYADLAAEGWRLHVGHRELARETARPPPAGAGGLTSR